MRESYPFILYTCYTRPHPFYSSYGQTGTGKTFTMEGERSPEGALSWEEVRSSETHSSETFTLIISFNFQGPLGWGNSEITSSSFSKAGKSSTSADL